MLRRLALSPPRARGAALLLLPTAIIFGILSALCWPLTYTISAMMIDYHFGFGKRGLVGAILALIDKPPYHFVTLAWMAFAVFASWLALLVYAAWRQIRADSG